MKMAAPIPARPSTPPTTPPAIAAVLVEWCAVDPELDAAEEPVDEPEAAADEPTPVDVGTFRFTDPVAAALWK
jgi:hypothetical protein